MGNQLKKITFPAYLVLGLDTKKRHQTSFQLIENYLGTEKFDNHPDLLKISPDPSIGIEIIRQVQNFLQLLPYSANFKLVLIEDAHSLTLEAQNALLKNLEEPTPSSIVILSAADKSQLIPTLTSRCFKIFVGDDIKIKININLDQFRQVWNQKPVQRLTLTNQIPNINNWLSQQLVIWRSILHQKLNKSKIDSNIAKNELIPIPDSISLKEIATVLTNLLNTQKALKANVNPQLAIDNLFLTLPQFKF